MGRFHKLYCDEYHLHEPPKCCSDTCWCHSKPDETYYGGLHRLMEEERMRMWRIASPHSNLHDQTCSSDCLKPSHYPDGDPLEGGVDEL